MPEKLIPRDVYAATFPMSCPACAVKAGMPYRATTQPEGMLVDMRCRKCAHEWLLKMDLAEQPSLPPED